VRKTPVPTASSPYQLPDSPSRRDAAIDELVAVREIIHAFLHANRPEDVYQFALDRVGPLVAAHLASVYLIDGASELMRLVAAYNWPERFRPWLGEARVRVGFGPSGEAASERRMIEIPDVFADDDLEDWQEVAAELEFRSLVALPLHSGNRVLGTLTFYFAGVGSCGADKKALLRIVADQMAATAEKAALIESLRRSNAALVDANAELEQQYVAVLEARRVRDEFLANISHELRTPLTAVIGRLGVLEEGISGPLTDSQREDLDRIRTSSQRLLALIEDLFDLTSLTRGGFQLEVTEFDPVLALRDAVAAAPPVPPTILLRVAEPATPVPPMRSDRRKTARILASLLSNACKFTAQGEVVATVEVTPDRVIYRIRDTGIGIPRDAHEIVFDEFRQLDGSATRRYGGSGVGLALARRLARALGGDVTLESEVGVGSTFTVALPRELDPSGT
jgi:signal transduction histidine kinase